VTDYRKPRFRTSQPGIASLHCFSSGPHYDPDNLSFGPILGLDEHLLEPGAGFDWHAHRGVHIVSWVLDGTLRHEDSDGVVRFVERGPLLVQSTGTGIRHTETNPSTTEPLRFVQLTILGENDPGVRSTAPPATVGGVAIDVRADVADAGAGRRRTVYAPEGVGRLLVLEVGT
jgi:redox-sensitive bicupin YhaK (pirin superfamily)